MAENYFSYRKISNLNRKVYIENNQNVSKLPKENVTADLNQNCIFWIYGPMTFLDFDFLS